MSVTVDIQTVPAGSTDLVDTVWELKEYIRRETGYLHQQHHFFADTYRQATTYLLYKHDTLIGFLSMDTNGYILFLGIHPDFQGEGYGKQLVQHALNNTRNLSCHTRVSNTTAVNFYLSHGFEISHTEEHYYEDNEDAYYLVTDSVLSGR